MADEYTAEADNVVPMPTPRKASSPSSEPKNLPDSLLFFDDLEPVVSANDFVEDLLTAAGMSVIYGESGSGKTFFATDLALHVACGWPWNGRDATRGAVLYCALEGSFGITNRIAAFKEHYGLSTLPFAILPVAIDMLNPSGDVEGVLDAINKTNKITGLPVVMTVMDTLSRAMAGGNENGPEDMGALVMNSTRLQQQAKTHVAWVHHSGKDQAKGARGHTSLRAATDTEIEIVAEGPSHCARVTKQRDLECVGEFPFTLKVIELGTNHRGKPVTSCIVDYGNAYQPALRRSKGRPANDDKARLAKNILADLLVTEGQTGFAPANLPSVSEVRWRQEFYSRACVGDDKPDTRLKGFKRAADRLLNAEIVATNSGRVWLTHPGVA